MIERDQLIKNLAGTGWFTQETAEAEADRLDLNSLDPDYVNGSTKVGLPIYGHNAIPHLFEADDGVPPQLRSYIASQERLARAEQAKQNNESLGDRPRAYEFHRMGVERICTVLMGEIDEQQEKPRHVGHCDPDGSAKHKNWCYALHVYCSRHGERATPGLLQLTFRVLGCCELSPSKEIARDLGMPYYKRRASFLEAVYQDGEYYAEHGVELSPGKLAARVGVDRKTIMNWRAKEDYQRRLRFVIGSA